MFREGPGPRSGVPQLFIPVLDGRGFLKISASKYPPLRAPSEVRFGTLGLESDGEGRETSRGDLIRPSPPRHTPFCFDP